MAVFSMIVNNSNVVDAILVDLWFMERNFSYEFFHCHGKFEGIATNASLNNFGRRAF